MMPNRPQYPQLTDPLDDLARARLRARPPQPARLPPGAADGSGVANAARMNAPPVGTPQSTSSDLDALAQQRMPPRNPAPASPQPIAPTAPKPVADPGLDALAQQRMQLNRGAIGGLGQGQQQQSHAFGGGPTPGIPNTPPDPGSQLGNRPLPQLQQPTPPAPTRAPTLTAGGMDLPPVDVRAAVNRIETGAGKGLIDASKYAQPFAPAQNQDLNELALLRQQQAADKAKLQEQAAARAGFSGGGLSGSTSAMMGDLSRTTDRTNNQAIIDTEKAQADRKWEGVKRDAQLDELELTDDHDYNKDGLIAGQKIGGVIGNDSPDDNPGNEPAPDPTNGGRGAAAKGHEKDRGSLFGFHPGADTFQVAPSVASSAVATTNTPWMAEYSGSDDSYDYYTGVDGKIWKVAR